MEAKTPKNERMTLRLDFCTAQKIREIAALEETTLSDAVRIAVNQYKPHRSKSAQQNLLAAQIAEELGLYVGRVGNSYAIIDPNELEPIAILQDTESVLFWLKKRKEAETCSNR